MTFFINFFFIFLLLSNQSFSQELIDDETYYQKGVEFYENGEFKKSFIVFFNLSEKGNKDAIYNLSNMYLEGIGTIQNYKSH